MTASACTAPSVSLARTARTVASFSVSPDIRRSFSLTWFPSVTRAPLPLDSLSARNHTRHYWHDWVGRCTYDGGSRDLVVRSLITLKALTYEPSGAVCAAATTSLPETIGGDRNWDYRYSWMRDATFTLHALLVSGYTDEAAAWVGWLRRAVAGNPGEMQIMYGVDGERRLAEFELDHLAGYEGSTPVRVGNNAATQLQLDVYGEVFDSAVTYWRGPLPQESNVSPDLMIAILDHLETIWREPDSGIWEVRGPRRHFTHSKVMAWVAFDRAVALAEDGVLPKGPMDHWRQLRDEIHAEVCEKGFDPELNSFTQYYGAKLLDASLLMLAPVGFLPPDDPRVVGTVEAIQKGLVIDGFVRRYQTDTDEDVDGLKGTEGAFLMTSFWLADNLVLLGRHDEAQGDLRSALCALQRRRSSLRGVRPEGRSAARELPAGLLTRRPDQHRRQPLDGRARPLGDAQSPLRPASTSERCGRLINHAEAAAVGRGLLRRPNAPVPCVSALAPRNLGDYACSRLKCLCTAEGQSCSGPQAARGMHRSHFCVAPCVDGSLVRGILAKPHADVFVVSPPILVRDIGQDLVVRLGRIAIQHPPRPQMAGDDGIKFGAVEADLREEEQKSHQPDDEAELAVGRGAMPELVLNESRSNCDEQRET